MITAGDFRKGVTFEQALENISFSQKYTAPILLPNEPLSLTPISSMEENDVISTITDILMRDGERSTSYIDTDKNIAVIKITKATIDNTGNIQDCFLLIPSPNTGTMSSIIMVVPLFPHRDGFAEDKTTEVLLHLNDVNTRYAGGSVFYKDNKIYYSSNQNQIRLSLHIRNFLAWFRQNICTATEIGKELSILLSKL